MVGIGRTRIALAKRLTCMFAKKALKNPFYKDVTVSPEDLHITAPVYRKHMFDIYSWEGFARRSNGLPVSIASYHAMSKLCKSESIDINADREIEIA